MLSGFFSRFAAGHGANLSDRIRLAAMSFERGVGALSFKAKEGARADAVWLFGRYLGACCKILEASDGVVSFLMSCCRVWFLIYCYRSMVNTVSYARRF